MEQCYINKIYWKGPSLYFELTNKDDGVYYLSNGKHSYEFENRKDCLYICLTNIEKNNMLRGDNYYLYHNGEKIYIQNECARKLDDYSRVFKYGLNYYAYVVEFYIDENHHLYLSASFYKNNKNPKKRDLRSESNSLKEYIVKIGKSFLERNIRLSYKVLSTFRRKKYILLMSETRSPISGNLKALDKKLQEANVNNVYYYFDKTLNSQKISLFRKWAILIWKLSGSYLVFTDDYAPIFKYLSMSKRTKLIQLWHAGVGFKAVGYARFGKSGSPYPYESAHRKYDYVVVGSKKLVSTYMEVFGLGESHFLPIGLPRLDDYPNPYLKKEFANEFYKIFPELESRKIILFAPTYRGFTQDHAFYPYDKIDFDIIGCLVDYGYSFLFKMHPFIKEQVQIPDYLKKYVIDVSKEFDINDLFYITDVLITDYSSSVYEYSLFNKPIIFYVFDYEDYFLERGMQNNLEELDFGAIVYSFEEIKSIILHEKINMKGLNKYVRDYHVVNQHACEYLIKHFVKEYEKKN